MEKEFAIMWEKCSRIGLKTTYAKCKTIFFFIVKLLGTLAPTTEVNTLKILNLSLSNNVPLLRAWKYVRNSIFKTIQC